MEREFEFLSEYSDRNKWTTSIGDPEYFGKKLKLTFPFECRKKISGIFDSSRKALKPIRPAELRISWGTFNTLHFSFSRQKNFELPSSNARCNAVLVLPQVLPLVLPIVLFKLKCTRSWYFSWSNMRALPTWVDKVHDKDRVEQWWELWYPQIFFFLYVAILIQNFFAWQHLRSCFQARWKSTHRCRWKPSLGI